MAITGRLSNLLTNVVESGGVARAVRLVEQYGTSAGTISRIRSSFPGLSQREAGRLFSLAQRERRASADVSQQWETGQGSLGAIPVRPGRAPSEARGRRIRYDMVITLRNPDGHIIDRREYPIYANSPLTQNQIRAFSTMRAMNDVGSVKIGLPGAEQPTVNDLEVELRSVTRYF